MLKLFFDNGQLMNTHIKTQEWCYHPHQMVEKMNSHSSQWESPHEQIRSLDLPDPSAQLNKEVEEGSAGVELNEYVVLEAFVWN